MALLYSLFYFFLKKETFHRFNRVCLLFTLLASLILPFVHITLSHPSPVNQAVIASTTYVTTLPTIVVTPETKAPLITWNDVLAGIYWIGLCMMLLYLALQIIQTYLLIKGGLRHTDKFGNTVILKDDVKSPFSIFHYIVMSVEDYENHRQNILTHEQEHIRMCHSYDLLLLEVVKVLQWFNPFVWFLENDLKALHEYQADEAVISQGIDAKQYQQLLVVKAVGNRLQPFANNLRRGSLKKRITMMYQKKSNRWMMLKALFVLPVTCFAIYAFATPEASVLPPQVKKTVATQQKKATPTTQQQKKAVAATQQKATPAPQKKNVYVQIKTDKGNITGSIQKEKAEQLAKGYEAKYGEKVKVTISDSAPNDSIYGVVDELAQFPGGEGAMYPWIAGHMKYPEEAVKNNIQGRVMVIFTVEKDGEITDVKAVRSPSPLLAEEAERVVKAMPKWKPAKNKGEIVRSTFNLPINFRLSSPQPSKE